MCGVCVVFTKSIISRQLKIPAPWRCAADASRESKRTLQTDEEFLPPENRAPQQRRSARELFTKARLCARAADPFGAPSQNPPLYGQIRPID